MTSRTLGMQPRFKLPVRHYFAHVTDVPEAFSVGGLVPILGRHIDRKPEQIKGLSCKVWEIPKHYEYIQGHLSALIVLTVSSLPSTP